MVKVEDINSADIRSIAGLVGATEAIELGAVKYFDGPDGWVTLLELIEGGRTRVLITPADPVWEGEEGFDEVADLILSGQ